MKLTADWLDWPYTRRVMDALTCDGAQALFVGGCVRNALLGVPVSDIDISTDATPESVTELAEQAGLKAVPTGIDHGTVTVVSDGHPFEVTTFRRDVDTDGRRATVAFSTRIEEDAERRDFTMNALYARPDGTIVDPIGGLPDLRARRVRFIGDPDERIAEDGLRILRFFRFHAAYGDPENGMDPDGLAAVARDIDRLKPVSHERIGAEVAKLLSTADPAPAVASMASSGVLARALPGADPRYLAPLIHLERMAGVEPAWRRRLAVLGNGDWADALRLSRADARHLSTVRSCLSADIPDHEAAYRHGRDVAVDAALIRAASMGVPLAAGWDDAISRGAAVRFPVKAADLMDRYGKGPDLGAAMKRLEDVWIARNFAPSRDDLIAIDKAGAR